jgi:hypothetical protein
MKQTLIQSVIVCSVAQGITQQPLKDPKIPNHTSRCDVSGSSLINSTIK